MPRRRARRNRYLKNFRDFRIRIPWDDFEYIMKNYFGFELDKKRGSSARTFTRDDETFVAYEPHGKKRGDKYVCIADRKKAIRALIRLGLLEEDS